PYGFDNGWRKQLCRFAGWCSSRSHFGLLFAVARGLQYDAEAEGGEAAQRWEAETPGTAGVDRRSAPFTAPHDPPRPVLRPARVPGRLAVEVGVPVRAPLHHVADHV